MRIIFMDTIRVETIPYIRIKAEFWADFFQAFDSFPKTFANERFRAEAFNEVESHVEFIAAESAELNGRVAAGEEDDGEGGDEEVVEADLLDAVDVGGLVEVRECADGVFGELDDGVGVVRVFLDGGGGVEDGAIDEDAHLVCAEVEEDLETVDGAGGGLG